MKPYRLGLILRALLRSFYVFNCGLRPGGAGEFDAPDGAAHEERTFGLDECGSVSGEDPDVGGRRNFSHEVREPSSDAADFNFHFITGGFAWRVSDRESLFARGSDRKIHNARLGSRLTQLLYQPITG